MINSKDILARLQNGETAENIANELINALNDANAEYEAEQAAKAKTQEREHEKCKAMQNILDALHDFCIEFYCESNEDINAVEEAFNELTAEKAINMVEETSAAVLKFEEHLKDIEKIFGDSPFNLSKPTAEMKPIDADAVISGFLKSIGLK